MNTMLFLIRTDKRTRNQRLQIVKWLVDPPAPIEIRHVVGAAWDFDVAGGEIPVFDTASARGSRISTATE